MANYPIPPWLTPSAAQGYGELAGQAARAGLSAELEREQMSQRAAQSAMEMQQRSQEVAANNQAKQEQLAYEHQMDQQKLAIENAYKQQQFALDANVQTISQGHLDVAKQQQDQSKQEFILKTMQAAQQHMAQQNFQKAILPKDQGGEGLTATQAALKYMAPYMTGTEVGRLSALPTDFKPGNVYHIPNSASEDLVQVAPNRWEKYTTTPQAVAQLPPAIPQYDSKGNIIGNLIQVPGEKPHFEPVKAPGKQTLKEQIAEREAQLSGGTTAPLPSSVSTQVDSAKPKAPAKAQGGYRIGIVYGKDMRYLGGDPKDESSWEKVAPQQ